MIRWNLWVVTFWTHQYQFCIKITIAGIKKSSKLGGAGIL
jgi:hypothetical protein